LADDWIFPECVEQMVACAEANPSVGIVSSYRMHGAEITGAGLPYLSTVVPGRKACQHILRDGYYLTGSPTSVLIRSDIVRETREFYPEGWLHDDTEACFRVLAEHDLGFIHQVLSFSRTENESVSSDVARFGPGPIRKFMFAIKYGREFFADEEYRKYLQREKDFYCRFIAENIFQFKKKEFWSFQRRGLRLVGADFWSIGLPKYVLLEMLDIVFNPKKTLGRIVRLMRNPEKKSESNAKTEAKSAQTPVQSAVREQPKGT